MTNFVTKQGDIFQSGAQVLVNPVNCMGAMGAGLAKQFKERYPALNQQYRKDCGAGKVKTGEVLLYRVADGRAVANLPTKNHWRDPSRLQWIKEGLADLNRVLSSENLTSVAIPAVGAGLGGLDWQEVLKLIKSELDNPDLTVEIYPPHRAGKR